MKTILALTFCLGLGLAQVGHAEDTDKNKRGKKDEHKPAAATEQAAAPAAKPGAATQKKAAAPKSHQQVQSTDAGRQRRNSTEDLKVKSATGSQQLDRNQRTVVQQNQNTRINQQTNVVVRNRNSFAQATQRNWRVRHDRDWWRRHFTTFVFFGGGCYYWNAGYWYPAYGYAPYSTYLYEEPIYGYNQLPPGQVIVNVQTELRREGYYYGPIDGLLGPATRSALARYQATHGLVVTRAIDEPTLQTMGMV